MRLAIGWLALVLAIFLVLGLQEFIPPVAALYGARVLLVPMLFCYGALAMPGWAMVPLALYTGLLTDLTYLQVVGGRVEIGLGWSIVYFVLFGLFAHGFQPAFQRGHWWLHIVLSAAGTSIFLLLQYAMICFRREAFYFDQIVAWRILGPGLFAAIVSPVFHLLVVQAEHFLPSTVRDFQAYKRDR